MHHKLLYFQLCWRRKHNRRKPLVLTQLQHLTKQRPSCNSNWCWCTKNHSIPPRYPRRFIPRRRPRRPCPWRKHGPKKRRRQSLGAQTIAGGNAHEQSHTTHATAKCVSHQAYNQYSIGGVDVPDRNQSHNRCRCPHPFSCPRRPRNEYPYPTLVGRLQLRTTWCSSTIDHPLKNEPNLAIELLWINFSESVVTRDTVFVPHCYMSP